MGKVMKANAASDLAYAQLDFGSPQNVVWLTFDVAFDADALAYFSANLSNDFADLLTNSIGFFTGADLWQLIVNITNQSATPPPAAASWFTIEIGLDNSTGTGSLYINGPLILTDSNPFLIGVPIDGFTVGQNNGGEADPAVVAYIRNVFAGTSQGASDLFPSDGFAGEDFSAWSSTFGDVSIVDDPFEVTSQAVRILVAFTDDTLTENPDFTDLAAL